MKKTGTILVNEVVTLLSRPSFWLTTLGIPLLSALIFGVVWSFSQSETGMQSVGQLVSGPQDLRPEGYVDLPGLIHTLPETLPPGSLLAFPDEPAAQSALQQGTISAYYLLPQDYLQSGQVIYIRDDFNLLASSADRSGLFLWALRVNLAGGDWMFANLVNAPLELEDISLAPPDAAPERDINGAAYWVPYGVTLLFYFLIFGSSSLLLSSISKEKENRVMELLLTAATPMQLLTGKIIGLGLVGVLQTALWLGTGYALMNLSGRAFSLPTELQITFSLVAWGLVFFILGYAMYASLLAGLGALAPNLREASQVTVVIIMPLIVPLFFASSVFTMDPNGPIATALSLFPLSGPVAMMARLSAGGTPWWHPPLAAALMAVTSALIVRAVARMFRAQLLLSGQPVKVKLYFQALFGRE